MAKMDAGERNVAIFDALDFGLVVLDGDRRIRLWNAWLAGATSIPATLALGRRLKDLFPDANLASLSAAVEASFALGTSRLLTHSLHPKLLPLRTHSGDLLVHDVTMRPLKVSGEAYCLIQVSDVTVAVKREGVLRERQNARYDAVVQSASDVIVTVDESDKIHLANPAAARQFGYESQELMGRSASVLFDDPRLWDELRSAVLNGEPVRQAVEIVARRKDGSRSYLELSLSRWVSRSRPFITAILRDVNERRTAEEKLRASEAQFRTLAQAMPNQVWTSLANGAIDWFNDRVYEYVGVADGKLGQGRRNAFVHPEDLPAVQRNWDEARSEGVSYETQLRIRRRDGVYRWHLVRAFPIRNAEGAIERWVGSNTDIEDQKVAAQALADINTTLEQRVLERTTQLLQAEDALRQSQKMEAVGQLTGGIAHDFNNLLQAIIGALNLTKKRIGEGRIREVDRFLDGALDSAYRAATLTHRLLAFSRRQPVDPRPIDVGQLTSTIEALVRRSIGEGIELVVRREAPLWIVRCDANQLENVLLNLAINARDAMPNGGAMTIAIANKALDAAAGREHELPPGDYVSLRISDTGVGMPANVKARAFDPFYTTKPIGKGTGLGLSMIYGFVRQSDGAIWIESEPGKGTTVEICLPRYRGETAAPAAEAKASVDSHAGPHEVVLVVEDQDAVRMLMVEVLNDLGYLALETADSAAALQILYSAQRIDLLVSDIGLPGLNGRQLADAARVKRPRLKVLFVTGYAEKAAGSTFLEPGMEIITKPFAMSTLASKIKEMIQNDPRA